MLDRLGWNALSYRPFRTFFLANFAGLTRHIIVVQIPGRDNAMPPDRLSDATRALGMRVEISTSV